jgi:uncharacterized cupredoxin-like copper-binding protein
MTVTETRPIEPESLPPLPDPVAPERAPRAPGWVGAAAGLGIVALAVALVALVVALGNTGSSRPLSASGPAPAAANAPAAGPAAAPLFTAAEIPFTLTEFKVSPTAIDVSAGTKTLQIANGGTVQHELLVFHPDASVDWANLPVGPDSRFNEDAPGLNQVSDGDNVDPGQSQSRQIDLTQPGTYYFVCNLPGHYKLGMWSKVTVH